MFFPLNLQSNRPQTGKTIGLKYCGGLTTSESPLLNNPRQWWPKQFFAHGIICHNQEFSPTDYGWILSVSVRGMLQAGQESLTALWGVFVTARLIAGEILVLSPWELELSVAMMMWASKSKLRDFERNGICWHSSPSLADHLHEARAKIACTLVERHHAMVWQHSNFEVYFMTSQDL